MSHRSLRGRVPLARTPDELPAWLIADPRRAEVVAFLAELPPPVYLVGGSIRDALLGRNTVDLDFAVDGQAIPVARALADAVQGALVVMDLERDVARVVVGKGDAAQHWDVAGLRASTIQEDLRARDLTINALALPLKAPQRLLDPTDGLADLRRGLLRATNGQAFFEDPVRVVRLARFRGELGLAVEPAARRLAREAATLLQEASPERIRDELFVLLGLPLAWRAVWYLQRLGGLAYVLPGMPSLTRSALGAGIDCLRALEYWSSAWRADDELLPRDETDPSLAAMLGGRWSEALAGGRTRWQVVKLAAILLGAMPDSVEGAAEALRLSNAEARLLEGAVAAARELAHGLPADVPDDLALYRFFRRYGDAGLDGAVLALARWSAEEAQAALRTWLDRYHEVVDPPRLVTGRDVMRVGGIEAGPRVGDMLEAVREAQVVGELDSRVQALSWLAQRAADEHEQS
ncbi:MAG: hypothetical protein ACP5G7_11585 [Anaerolineae bacterium]